MSDNPVVIEGQVEQEGNMSNQMIPIQQGGGNLPAYAQSSGPVTLDDITIGGGVSVPRLSLRNNQITLIAEGVPAASFGAMAEMVIVGAQPGFGRVYYGKQYDPSSDGDLPVCWSQDGKTADPQSRQCPSPDGGCASCPMNVKGSATNGKGKACQYIKNLAVIVLNDPVPGRVCRLSIKGGSLFGPDHPDQQLFNFKNLGAYLSGLDAANVAGVIIRALFDTSPQATPNKLLFQPVGWVDEQWFIEHVANISDDQIRTVVGLDFGAMWDARDNQQNAPQATQATQATQAAPVSQGIPAYAQQPVQQPAQAAPQPVQQPVQQPAQAAPQPVQAEPQPVQQPVQAEPQPVQQPEQPAQQASDGGAPAASADALAASIKEFGVDL